MVIQLHEYWDEYSLLHVKRGQFSENGVLFATQYYLLRFLNQNISVKDMLDAQDTFHNTIKKGFFDPNPSDDNKEDCHFSHDNMTALYCLGHLLGMDLKKLPISLWNGRNWYHPRDLIFYNVMQENKLSYLLMPLLCIISFVSALSSKGRTSGKMLLWLRLNILKRHKNLFIRSFASQTLKLCLRVMPNEGMVEVSSIYFKKKDHPVNVEMRRLYDK